MKKHFTKKQLEVGIIGLLFILTPLISAVLFCLKDGRGISDIYIPLGGWSDEITYYKQIEGILYYGMPRGYFGYNQSRALYGSLGVWGIVPLIPYVAWGWLFGWDYCAPMFANITFCVIALLVFYVLLRPRKKWMGMISVFWIINQFLNRYVLSGVVEASVITQMMIVATCGEYLLSEKIRGQQGRSLSPAKDNVVFILCTGLICVLTLGRPYFAVLYLIPFWKAIREKQKVRVVVLPVLAIGILALFFLNNHFFCSTYFSNVLSFEKIKNAGLAGLFIELFNGLVQIARLIWYAVRYKGIGVGWYYLLLFIELSVMFCTCVMRKLGKKEVPKMFVINLVGDSLIVISLILLYDLSVGARHILALIVINAVLLIMEAHVVWGGVLAAVCLFSILQTQGADALPYKVDAYAEYMENLEEVFSEVVSVTEGISYDNVVAMPTADTDADETGKGVSTYYGLLFAMPPGVGISLDFQDFYDVPENIKAGYIMVHPEGKIRMKLEDIGMFCIFENQELAIYTRRR